LFPVFHDAQLLDKFPIPLAADFVPFDVLIVNKKNKLQAANYYKLTSFFLPAERKLIASLVHEKPRSGGAPGFPNRSAALPQCAQVLCPKDKTRGQGGAPR
jgi:hypothetical protein